MSNFPLPYPFAPPRKINDADWDLVINNITGSQIKSGSLILSTSGTTTGLSVSGITNLNVLNVTGSSVFNQSSTFGNITGSILSIGSVTNTGSETISGNLTVGGNQTIGGNLGVGGLISGTISGGLQTTGSIIIPSGSNLNLQSGSMIPFALPATYVVFSGSIPGIPGPFYSLNGSNNKIAFNGSDAGTVIGNTWNSLLNGGLIHIKAGTYPIISLPALIVFNNITLEGEGSSTILFLNPGTSRSILSLSSGAQNIIIRNMTFDGNGSSQSATSNVGLIQLLSSSSSGFQVINCTFQNSANACIVTLANDNLIIGSLFKNNVLAQGGGSGYNGSLGVGTVIVAGTNQFNTRIIGNTFDSNFGGFNDADTAINGVLIENNIFINNSAYPVQVQAASDIAIVGNYFIQTLTGNPTAFIALASSTAVVSDNVFHDAIFPYVSAFIYDLFPVFHIITGNYFQGATGAAAILTQYNSVNNNITISNNVFRLPILGQVGISIQGLNNFIVSNNQFNITGGGTSLSFDNAIQPASTNGLINSNIFGGSGIVINKTPSNTIINGNLP